VILGFNAFTGCLHALFAFFWSYEPFKLFFSKQNTYYEIVDVKDFFLAAMASSSN